MAQTIHHTNRFILLFVVVLLVVAPFAVAEEEEEDDEDDDRPATTIRREATPASTPQTKMTTSVVTKTETVVIRDSDGDGAQDGIDRYPDIPDFYIVADDNGNGINDLFEGEEI